MDGAAAYPALSQLMSWDSRHLSAAAATWTDTADRWEHAFHEVNAESAAPNGHGWEGITADHAFHRT